MSKKFSKVGALNAPFLSSTGKLSRDPKRNQTVLHLSTLGAIRGEQNNTFVDDSPNRFTITRTGNVAPSTFSPYGDSWSNYFDGNGDYLSVPISSQLDIGTSDFTVECWINTTTSIGEIVSAFNSTAPYLGWLFGIGFNGFSNKLVVWLANSTDQQTYASNASVNDGTWKHVAFTKTGTTLKFFINGTLDSTHTVIASVSSSNQSATIGADNNTTKGRFFTGNISNLRIVKGTALYTANFTPSKTPLTAVSGTSLLTCASNRFQDKSSNNFTITPAGNVAVKTTSPFPQAREFKKPQRGWCVPFNGSTQYLETPAATSGNGLTLGTSNFTIEFWVKAKPQSGFIRIIDSRTYNNSNYGFVISCENTANSQRIIFEIYKGVTVDYLNFALPNVLNNTWNHVAIVRTGDNIRGYVNGTYYAQLTLNSNNRDLNYQTSITIGAFKDPTTNAVASYFSGKISNVMIVKKALYSGNFVPMQSPRTADQLGGTQATLPDLLACQGQSVTTDYSYRSNTMTPAGSVAVDSDSPFDQDDELSYYFDGIGDYLSISDNAALELGSGDFTIECWVNPAVAAKAENNTDGSRNSQIMGKQGSYGLGLWGNSSNYVGIYFASTADGATWTNLGGNLTISQNRWYHIAASRQSGTLRVFIDGTLINWGAYSSNITNIVSNFVIGGDGTSGTNYAFNGYVSNARLVTGAALYTASFTPSRKPLGIAGSGSTALLTCRGRTSADQSNNNLIVTVFGTAGTTANPVSRKSPFNQDERYGMSYYFNNSDTLNVSHTGSVITPMQLGTGDFTIEFWVYFNNAASAAETLFDYRSDGAISAVSPSITRLSTGVVVYISGGNTRITGGVLPTGAWTHIALVRSSAVTKLYVNGQQSGSNYADSNSYILGTNRPIVGGSGAAASSYILNGYISGFSLQKGVAKYTAAFTPPSSPQLTGDYSQSLLLNAYPAIYDTTRKNAIETITTGGSASANLGVPWGARAERYASYFNGNADYLTIPYSPDFDFGTGDFTIETWIYLSGDSATDGWGNRNAGIISSNSGAGQGWYIYVRGDASTTGTGLDFAIFNSGVNTPFSATFTIQKSTWHHIVLVRKNGIIKLFFNGLQQGTDTTITANLSSNQPILIGAVNLGSLTRYLNGGLHDLRVTKGFARYTSNFAYPKLTLSEK